MSFSPDGATLAWTSCANEHSYVRLWTVGTDAKSSRELDDSKSPSKITEVCFSPDGATLAWVNGASEVQLWDLILKTKKIVGCNGKVKCIGFSPDGTLLASGSDQAVQLWGARTKDERVKLVGQVNSISFSPDGATLAAASDFKSVCFWDVAAAKEEARFRSPVGSHTAQITGNGIESRLIEVTNVILSPDGATLASVSLVDDRDVEGESDKAFVLQSWDMATGKERLLQSLPIAFNMSFSRDSRALAIVSNEKALRMWDAAKGQLISNPDDIVLMPVAKERSLQAEHGVHRAIANGSEIAIYDTSIQINLASYLPYFEIERDRVEPKDLSAGMPFLNVNPYSHIGILQSGKPQDEINRLLYWRYYQAMNKNSARLMLARLPPGPEKDDAQDAFDRRFGTKEPSAK